MNDRMRAIAILREAKETLAARLTEQVLDLGEEILADARGDSYMNEIESVYEQLGMKLAHVNQMLSNLPEEIAPPPTATATATAADDGRDTFSMSTGPAAHPSEVIVADATAALPGPVLFAAPALPSPKPTNDSADPPRSFQGFAAYIQAGDLLAAGRSLADLLELEEPRAIACAATFADRLRRDPGFLRRTRQLRQELESANPDGGLALLRECFGLNRSEAAAVLTTLRRRLHIER